MRPENLKSDLTVVAIEVLLIVVAVTLLYWLTSRCLALVFSLPLLDRSSRGRLPSAGAYGGSSCSAVCWCVSA